MAATQADLPNQWRSQAQQLRTSAKAYKRSCVKHKMVQNLMLAAQLEQCADELQKALAESQGF